MRSTRLPGITIVIPTIGRDPLLRSLLQALAEQGLAARACNVLVIDNAASTTTRALVEAMAHEHGLDLRWIGEPQAGVTHARNSGVRAAERDWVGFLDDDVVPNQDWLDVAFRLTEEPSDTACVGGSIAPLWELEPPTWLRGRLLERLGVLDFGSERRRVLPPLWINGANMLIRRDAFDSVGLFSVALGHRRGRPLSSEEPELCRRLELAGGQTWYCPELKVGHRMGATQQSRRNLLRRAWWLGFADALIDRRHGGERTPLRELAARSVDAARPQRWVRAVGKADAHAMMLLADDLVCAGGYAAGLVASLVGRSLPA